MDDNEFQKTFVGSSTIAAGTFDPEKRQIKILFNSGVAYLYENCTEEDWIAIRDAASPGKAVNAVLKVPAKPYKRIS